MYHMILVSIKIVILLLTAVISIISYIAYKRRNHKLMLFVSIGFGTYSAGTLIEGLLYEFIFHDYLPAHLVESIIVLMGLATILYGLRRR